MATVARVRALLALTIVVLVTNTADAGLSRYLNQLVHWSTYFVDNPAEVVGQQLKANVLSQDPAIDAIIEAVEMWHVDRVANTKYPLVMALSGTTGVGKTYTARLLAEALLSRPAGVLELRGEDYASTDKPDDQLREELRDIVMDHVMKHTQGAVVVFDEMQKARGEVLSGLVSALEKGHAYLQRTRGKYVEKADCSNVVWIIISDVATSQMEGMISTAESHPRAFQRLITNAVVAHFHDLWDGSGIAGHVQLAVAMPPYTRKRLVPIIKLHLDNMLGNLMTSGKCANVNYDDNLPVLLSSARYVNYTKSGSTTFARYGARDVAVRNTGSVNSLKQSLLVSRMLVMGQGSTAKWTVNIQVADDKKTVVIEWCPSSSSGRQHCTEAFRGMPGFDADEAQGQ